MTASPRETALAELLYALEAAAEEDEAEPVVLRNADLPQAIPPGGLLILRDGDPGEPEVTFSPHTWHWEHRAQLEVFAAGSNAEARLDALCALAGGALASDRILGGAVDWAEAGAPAPSDLPLDGAEAVRAAILTILLVYASPTSTG
jgi:hypothetical protein